ncbi:MAG: DUF5916 domain-containing protein [Vicinamibacterales bacterium]
MSGWPGPAVGFGPSRPWPPAAIPVLAFTVALVPGLGGSALAQPLTISSLVERMAPDQVTIRAVRLDGPLHLDGRLDEDVYAAVAPLTDFLQQEPREGQPATEKTEAWILFDDTSLYVAARCWDSHPEREVANELRRDNGNILGNENVTFVIDTFHDRRNGYLFQTNPLGALRDMTVTDDLQNSAWNGIWYVKTGRFAHGWTVEVAIPFKTLRYRGSGPQTWGLNLRRLVKWKNEFSYLSLVPAALGTAGVSRMASAATLVGLETPAESKNVELKPYAVAAATTAKSGPGYVHDGQANAGLDFKYGLTRSLIVDATVRTDFAQVEEDLQQINLTRFSVFFPEKREFFIEGQGIFDFGGVQAGNSPGDVPLPFFSRQIGLSQGQAVPVLGGVRLTGRTGPYSIGALDIHTDDAPGAGAVATGFSVLRLKRNLFRRSNVGVIATRRGPAAGGAPRDRGDASYTLGADATLLFLKSVNLTGFYVRTAGPDATGRAVAGTSYRGRFDYTDDRYGASAEHMVVERDFRPEVGFVRRPDMRRTFGQLRFSPRPRRNAVVRKLTWQASYDYVTDAAATTVQSREAGGLFRLDFQTSDQLTTEYTREYERLPDRFAIAPGVLVPAGGYTATTGRISYGLGQQRRISGRLSAATGTLYGGTRTEFAYSGRWGVVPRFSIEPAVAVNVVDLPYGEFTARLVSTRFTVTPTARMLLSSLVQVNVDQRTTSASLRLRWEYTGGSELFVVYSDGRDSRARGVPVLVNRTLAVKATRLFRY